MESVGGGANGTPGTSGRVHAPGKDVGMNGGIGDGRQEGGATTSLMHHHHNQHNQHHRSFVGCVSSGTTGTPPGSIGSPGTMMRNSSDEGVGISGSHGVSGSSSLVNNSDATTIQERVRLVVQNMSPLEYSCAKSTTGTPMRAPKRKHVERLVRATWMSGASGASACAEILRALSRVDALRSPTSALKMCGIVHALMQHGSGAILHPVYSWRDHLDILVERYSSDFGARGRSRERGRPTHRRGLSSSSAGGFAEQEALAACASMIAPYAAFIRAKAKFHRHFVAFENNYSVDARVETLEDEDDIGMSDPVSTLSLGALLAVASKARRVLECAMPYLPNISESYVESEGQWLELVGFVAKLVLREADLAYRAAVFVAATLAEEKRLGKPEDEKFRTEHDELRRCFEEAFTKTFLRDEFALERDGSHDESATLVHMLAAEAPNFLESENIHEILSANAPAKKHVLSPSFNLMDADMDATNGADAVVANEMPPLINLDDSVETTTAATTHYNPFGLLPPTTKKPGHERKPSDFDLDAFTAPLEFTPLQSGPASMATYVDPFAVPAPQQANADDLLDMNQLAHALISERSPNSTPSPARAQKPPKSPMISHSASEDNFEEIPLEDLEFGRQIGRGAFGEVFRGKLNGTDVAIKRLCIMENVSDERGMAEFRRELKFLTRLRHRHIVQFLGACTTPPNLCIIMDYCDKGSLYGYLHNMNKAFSPFKALKWMSECAKGLVYLHSKEIIHRDIKSGNLLIDEGGSIKLGDFGLSKLHTGGASTGGTASLVGTYQFMAPELLDGHPQYTTAVDVYSFGVVCWECLTRKEPFHGLSPMQIVAALLRGERPEIEGDAVIDLPQEYVNLMRRCWDADARRRPSMTEAASTLERLFMDEKRALIANKQKEQQKQDLLLP